ncbi:MAG: class I SAM-dependent methyltransferase [Polymorphobacter sp.]|uniref:class I SAM-dependent methyltransferase n=1 Tax=Polymorphobacter sp. TaxID=1909290 RepID=UPI003A8A88CE
MGIYSERIFPWLLDRTLSHPRIEARRAALVGQAAGEVLEIGFGSGATLPFYDPEKVTRLTVVEPSEGMNRRAAARTAQSRIAVRSVPGAGERLPFEDASFDTVVVCLTLCSVDDPMAVLGEVRRVLRAGGRFLFLEHVLSADAGRAKWQRRLTPVQKVVGVGCHLDRDTAAMVRAAGFALGPVAAEEERAFGALAPLAPLIAGAVSR